MMLTKKGSTRGTVSVLFLSALIFLLARFAVNAIETAMPNNSRIAVAWKPIPDYLKDKKHTIMVDEETDFKPVSDDQNKESKEAVGSTAGDESYSKEKLNEAKKILESQPKTDLKDEKPAPTATAPAAVPAAVTAAVPKKTKKRFALEKIFPDNVDQRPVFIFFGDDSMISQKMENTSLGIAQIREKIEKDFYPIRIRFDKKMSKTEYRLYQEYGSTAVPAVNIVTSTGEALAYNSGFISATKVMVLLSNAHRKQLKLAEKTEE